MFRYRFIDYERLWQHLSVVIHLGIKMKSKYNFGPPSHITHFKLKCMHLIEKQQWIKVQLKHEFFTAMYQQTDKGVSRIYFLTWNERRTRFLLNIKDIFRWNSVRQAGRHQRTEWPQTNTKSIQVNTPVYNIQSRMFASLWLVCTCKEIVFTKRNKSRCCLNISHYVPSLKM